MTSTRTDNDPNDRPDIDRLLDPSPVAKILGISLGTLHRLGRQGEGPEFVWVGGQRRYPRKALERFIGVSMEDD